MATKRISPALLKHIIDFEDAFFDSEIKFSCKCGLALTTTAL